MAISVNERQPTPLIAQIRRRKNRANTLFARSLPKCVSEVSARDAPGFGGDLLRQSVAALPAAERCAPNRARAPHVLGGPRERPGPRMPLVLTALALARAQVRLEVEAKARLRQREHRLEVAVLRRHLGEQPGDRLLRNLGPRLGQTFKGPALQRLAPALVARKPTRQLRAHRLPPGMALSGLRAFPPGLAINPAIKEPTAFAASRAASW